MDRERADRRDRDEHDEAGHHPRPDADAPGNGADRNRPTLPDGGPGPAPTAPGPAPKRTDEADRSPTWLEIMLPVLIVLLLATLALLWNIVAAIVVLIIGVGVILSWVIQRRQPHEPGE